MRQWEAMGSNLDTRQFGRLESQPGVYVYIGSLAYAVLPMDGVAGMPVQSSSLSDTMSAQVNDQVFHLQIEFSITRNNGTELFEPRFHGIIPGMMHSACSRGYISHFAIEDGRLFLSKLISGARDEGGDFSPPPEVPTLFGRQAKLSERYYWEFENLEHPIDYSGGLLLGADFIMEHYLHAGFHAMWKYRLAREVIFDHGRLSHDFDRSEEMQEIRDRIREQGLHPGLAGAEAEMVRQWFRHCLIFDYGI